MSTSDVLSGAPPAGTPRAQPLSVELPADPAEWLARTGHAGAYERFLALATEVFPKGTTFENTLEMHEGGEYVVECVATAPARGASVASVTYSYSRSCHNSIRRIFQRGRAMSGRPTRKQVTVWADEVDVVGERIGHHFARSEPRV